MGEHTQKRETQWCVRKADAAYPQALHRIRNAPRALYVRGELPHGEMPSVAVIGARRCSSYGREMAEWFAGELAGAGVQIISGMAAGIDGIAQRAALKRGRSFAVLGCGTDICYPAENRDLYRQLMADGGILSEYPEGTPPVSAHFPRRNRIISGLADAVLVIEAKERSGTMITVDFALEQGRDVFALPGRLTDALSGGCNSLIAQGAGIARRPEDILETLYGKGKMCAEAAGCGDAAQCRAALPDTGFTGSERIVLTCMGDRPLALQELYERIRTAEGGNDMTLAEVTDLLMRLTVRGAVSRERGNKYERRGCHSESFVV